MIGGIAAFLAILLFIVAHEAGHYLSAKAFGMKVTEFFIGFGPRLWSFRRGETEYGIKPIPFGAYVKIIGMSADEEIDPADVGRTYRDKPFWQRSVVVLAGVAANFLIAFVMLAGLALAEGRPVLEDGELVPSTVVETVVPTIEDGSPTAAAEAGLRPGDRIVAVDGSAIGEWTALMEALAARPGELVTLGIERDGERIDVEATLGSRLDPETGVIEGFLGVGPGVLRQSVGAGTAAGLAARQIVDSIGFTFVSFGRLLQLDTLGQLVGGIAGGEVPAEVRPVSVVGVVQIGAQADEIGIGNFVFLLAVMNVILGTVNALPLFPLDGGHFAVALYEKVTGRRPNLRALIPVAVAVIGVISLIGLLAIVLDIVNPIDV